MAFMAQKRGYHTLYVPTEDAAESSLTEGLDVYPVPNLLLQVDNLTGHARMQPYQPDFSLGDEADLLPYAADLVHKKA